MSLHILELKRENERLEIEQKKSLKKRNDILVEVASNREKLEVLIELTKSLPENSIEVKTIKNIIEKAGMHSINGRK